MGNAQQRCWLMSSGLLSGNIAMEPGPFITDDLPMQNG